MLLHGGPSNKRLQIVNSKRKVEMGDNSNNSKIWVNGMPDTHMLGTTGKGKSKFCQQYADQEGISYEEAEKRWQPTEEMLEDRRQQVEVQRMKDAKRIQAVRDAYWAATDTDSNEFSTIYDACAEFIGAEISSHQSKEVFDILPKEIIGSGIQWGFNDTEVRDNIYCFIRDNSEEIKKKLGFVPT